MRRSRPPSIVMISRIRGDVEVRYCRCCNELVSGSGAVVSSAVEGQYQDQVRSENAEILAHLACRRAGRLCRRMPCSAPEKQSLTRALHWRRRRIQSLESFSSGARTRATFVCFCLHPVADSQADSEPASAPCWLLMQLSEHPCCVYNITIPLGCAEDDLRLHIRRPNRQFVLHGVAKYRLAVPCRHAVSARLDVLCALGAHSCRSCAMHGI